MRWSGQLLRQQRLQRLLLLRSHPQHGAAGAAVRGRAHRPRPRLHVLPGRSPQHVLSAAHITTFGNAVPALCSVCLTGSPPLSLQVLLFVFSILRKVAWDYGRLALVTDADR